ncbi:MAG: four helix bundle protein [Geminocystis sp.]|nr:four helix bundle protein [Geminocystis sp.]
MFHNLRHSRGGAHELNYYLPLSKDLGYLTDSQFKAMNKEITAIIRMLNSLINSLRKKINPLYPIPHPLHPYKQKTSPQGGDKDKAMAQFPKSPTFGTMW